jgi:hypothetical protein
VFPQPFYHGEIPNIIFHIPRNPFQWNVYWPTTKRRLLAHGDYSGIASAGQKLPLCRGEFGILHGTLKRLCSYSAISHGILDDLPNSGWNTLG